MRAVWTIMAAAVMALTVISASPALAQSRDDLANLDKCVGYEACKAIQDRIDAIKAGASAIVDRVSNALTPTDNRSYFEKFSFEERKEAKAACLRNLAGNSCPNYLTAEEEERLNPRPKAPPQLSPEVVRSRELQLLQADDISVAGMLDLKCFTPEMANGGFYGDCTFALTRLNLLEKSARRLGVTLRASEVARQYGFPRSADGTWDDKYARVSVPQRQAESVKPPASAPVLATASGLNGEWVNLGSGNRLWLEAKDDGLHMTGGYSGRKLESIYQQIGPGVFRHQDLRLPVHVRLPDSLLEVLGPDQFRATVPGIVNDVYQRVGAPIANSALPAPTTIPKPTVAPGLNGEWQGQSSGNHVRLEVRAGGIFVTPVSQSAGQTAQGFMYRDSGSGSYRFQFSPGQDSVLQMLGADQLRVTNPDGWTDVFKRVDSSTANSMPQAIVQQALAPNLNGDWVGQSSGNRVRLEVQAGGVSVFAITQNTGQIGQGFVFRESGSGTYRYQFSAGKNATLQLLGPGQFRVTYPDGWTDVFKRASP
jgi:hypothetical protein